ncbi:inactive transglutaminase family protein [Thiococcus pfennigii]|uniref:inactive transglutaminase family protein n=1 Tax=Thiococcus pfennigii TaxID=1057 RepID=UPI0019084DD6|nr:inactive transglutaminase family protein [Thiococcus pfennigii]
MIASRTQVALIVGLLLLLGLGLTLYKTTMLGFPLLPGEYRDVWTIESKISFQPKDEPLTVELELPQGLAGWTIIEEHFASSGFGFSVRDSDGHRKARWTREGLDRPTTLYYKIQTYRAAQASLPDRRPRPVRPPRLEPDQLAAMDRLVAMLRERSAGIETFTELMIQEINRKTLDQDVEFLLGTYQADRVTIMLDILASAGIAAQRVRGIALEDGRRRQTISSLIEVHNGSDWTLYHPETAATGLPPDFFVWERGDEAILTVVGGQGSSLEFALLRNTLPAKTVMAMEHRTREYALVDFSIYALPVEQQGVFKTLLLIPVGALVVVFLRLFVGIPTSGTFMPVLIALAFIETTLLVGLLLFIILVGVGLWIRSWLSRLNLLLVARVSTVVIVVVLLMAVFALGSYKLGLDQALTVTFFPTIILAWTIERMSILWEEDGPHEVLIQGGGSLLVAVLAYLVMTTRVVEHLTFNFPELLISLLAVIILIGRYTGYRLSELYRFRDLAKPK